MTTQMNVVEVLVVDDYPELKMHLRQILEENGYTVTWVVSWKGVEEVLSERKRNGKVPDIVMVDLHIVNLFLSSSPKREGLLIISKIKEFCEYIRLTPPPIIAFTEKLNDVDKKEVMQMGAFDFIEKEEFEDRKRISKRILQCLEEAFILQTMKNEGKNQPMDKKFIQNALDYAKDYAKKDELAASVLGLTLEEFLSERKRTMEDI